MANTKLPPRARCRPCFSVESRPVHVPGKACPGSRAVAPHGPLPHKWHQYPRTRLHGADDGSRFVAADEAAPAGLPRSCPSVFCAKRRLRGRPVRMGEAPLRPRVLGVLGGFWGVLGPACGFRSWAAFGLPLLDRRPCPSRLFASRFFTSRCSSLSQRFSRCTRHGPSPRSSRRPSSRRRRRKH